MSAQETDTSTRTIAGIAAVLGILALLLTVVESSRTGLVAQVVGTTKEVSEQNDLAILSHIDVLKKQVGALEAKVGELEKQAQAQAQAAAAPPPAE